jgi:hypothetical protein
LITGETSLRQLKANHIGIVVAKAWIGDTQHRGGPLRPLTGHSLVEITGEGG